MSDRKSKTPMASLRRFFASRFSLGDSALWRLMQLLRPRRRQIIIANIALTFASALQGVALLALVPMINSLLTTTKAPTAASAEADPESSQFTLDSLTGRKSRDSAADAAKPKRVHLRERVIQYGERWAWFRNAEARFRADKAAFEAWIEADSRRFAMLDIGFVLFLYILCGGCLFVGNYLMSKLAMFVSTTLMRDVYGNVLRQELEYFDHNSSGTLLNTCFREVFQLQTMIPMVASRRIILPVSMLVYFIALLGISARLSFLLMVLLPIVVVPTFLISRRLKASVQSEIGEEASVLDVMTQGISGIQAIKAFGAESLEAEQVEPCIRDYIRFTRKRRIAQAFIGPLVDLLNMVVLISVVVLALFIFPQVLQTAPGRLAVFLIALQRFYKPMRTLMTMNIQMQRAQMVAKHIFEMLDRQPRIQEAPDALPFPDDWDALRFEDVGLIYTVPKRRGKPMQRLALQNVHLAIGRGEIIGLVGPNGAGKSSIVKLICRLYEPTSGRILFGQTPLGRIQLATLRDRVCLITQHPVLFNRPVAENITFGLEGIGQDRIEAAARAVRAHDFIMRMPQGYDSLVGESGKLLSGGERQKLVLARAFVRNPSLLIFDEPTAGLDRESVAEMIELIGDLRRRGITIIWITHDQEHLIHCDRILELTAHRTVAEVTNLLGPR